MPGPTPLTVQYRVVMKYTVDGLQHRMHAYLSVVASLDSTGYDTIARPGFTAVGVSTIGDNIFLVMKPFYDPAFATFDGTDLEHLVSGHWTFVAHTASGVTPTGSTGYQKAMMLCLSGKAQDNTNMPVYLYEGQFNGNGKQNSYASMSAIRQALEEAFFNDAGTAVQYQPVAWRRSRGSVYSSRWLALLVDTNEKLRRIRHIK